MVKRLLLVRIALRMAMISRDHERKGCDDAYGYECKRCNLAFKVWLWATNKLNAGIV